MEESKYQQSDKNKALRQKKYLQSEKGRADREKVEAASRGLA